MTQKELLKPITPKISNIQDQKQIELSEIQQAIQEMGNPWG